MRRQARDSRPATSGGRARHGYLALAWLCVSIGVVGIFVPLLPTTVFLLIAAWAFSRSSPRWHAWLRGHARFGEAVRNWEEHHAIPRRAKRAAFIALAVSYAVIALLFGPFSWVAGIGGLCLLGVALYIARIPVAGGAEKQSART